LVYQGKIKMNDRPTPETDAAQHEGLIRGNAMPTQVVRANFARKLERERDEAREALASREVVIAQQNVITDLMLERDEALEALMKIEEVLIENDDTYEASRRDISVWALRKMGNIARAALWNKNYDPVT
jgi:hypothetical protein